MRQRRCLASAAVLDTRGGYSKQLVPGQVYDVEERTPSGCTLADLTKAEWFEDVTDAESAPSRARRKPQPLDESSPASPAQEE